MTNWNKPKKVDNIDLLFGPKDAKRFIPSMKEIPKEYHKTCHPLNKLVRTWFFNGLQDVQFRPKIGIDEGKALKQIKCCLMSFELSHEHKMAGCAYLMDLFFNWE